MRKKGAAAGERIYQEGLIGHVNTPPFVEKGRVEGLKQWEFREMGINHRNLRGVTKFRLLSGKTCTAIIWGDTERKRGVVREDRKNLGYCSGEVWRKPDFLLIESKKGKKESGLNEEKTPVGGGREWPACQLKGRPLRKGSGVEGASTSNLDNPPLVSLNRRGGGSDKAGEEK